MLAASSTSSHICASPSLNSYSASNNTLAEVAARVAHELRLKDEDPLLSFEWYEHHDQTSYYYQLDHEDEEFEFSFMCGNPQSSSLVPADEIFHNGQIKPFYSGNSSENRGRIVVDGEVVKKTTRRPQLRVLMGAVDDRASSSSCSSSEADELDRIAPGTYCIWKPPAAACKKSSSTGSSASSSRRWMLKQLLLMKRSNSAGGGALGGKGSSGRQREGGI